MRALALALLLAACAAPDARMREAAEVMAPLIGCWRGTSDDSPAVVDERCFSVLDGRHVVDTHEVRPTEYSGETMYHLDETSGRIAFAYASSAGGRSNGELAPIENGFAFPRTHSTAPTAPRYGCARPGGSKAPTASWWSPNRRRREPGARSCASAISAQCRSEPGARAAH